MRDVLRAIYYSKKNKGLLTAAELAAEAQRRYVNVTTQQAQQWINEQENAQRFKKPSKQLYPSITASLGTYQCDLLFLKDQGKLNLVLVMVEITTRKGYFRALKDKTAAAAADALQSILDVADPAVDAIEHDSGAEFQSQFKQLLEDNSIIRITTRKDNSTIGGELQDCTGQSRAPQWHHPTLVEQVIQGQHNCERCDPTAGALL